MSKQPSLQQNSEVHANESYLVAQLKGQEKGALSYLYDHYSAALYGMVLRIVKQECLAEEVLQDVFLKIWNTIGQYNADKGRLYTWMFRIARNQSLDKLRTKEMQQELKTSAIADNLASIDLRHNGQQQVDTIGLDKFLNQLQTENQLVIRLIYLQGYTHAQVAEEYGIPLGTVKTRHRMALIHLRKLLVKEI